MTPKIVRSNQHEPTAFRVYEGHEMQECLCPVALEQGFKPHEWVKASDEDIAYSDDRQATEETLIQAGLEWFKDPRVTISDAEERKATPIATGVLAYFPDALAEVARVSRIGNEQHNPGQPLHWDKSKSTDEDDALSRHLTDRLRGEVFDKDGVRHRAKVAWRALAGLQREIDAERADDLS